MNSEDKAFKKAARRLLQMHYEARVGHLGGNLSSLPALYVLFNEILTADDAFVLSKGHSAGALYVALWSVGEVHDDDLKTFHADGTGLPGHPPIGGIQRIPFATGSLGHGLSLAAGLALGKKLQGLEGQVVCLTSDGEWQEGSTWEALIFAQHQKLSNVTILVDHNGLQGFGSTGEVASMNPLWEKLRGFEINTYVIDGHDRCLIRETLEQAKGELSLIFLKTVKGKGVAVFENKMESHYLPLDQAAFEAATLVFGDAS